MREITVTGAALTPVARSMVEPLREYGVYGPALEPGAGADDAAALLGHLGRRYDWGAWRLYSMIVGSEASEGAEGGGAGLGEGGGALAGVEGRGAGLGGGAVR